MGKVHNKHITKVFLTKRTMQAERNGYPKAKWIFFAETMLNKGLTVSLNEAQKSVSKYLTVIDSKQRTFKVRFSNHKPILQRELRNDCDFFVGRTNNKVTTTTQAIQATNNFFYGIEFGKDK